MTRALALALRDRFAALGARGVEPPVLLQADVLLDLYGEDIRGRAYVTADALRGEQMLRPDFTVPVVQMHMAEGTAPARYTYAGEVFRRQEDDPERDNEYLQVGYEVFDATDPAAADADVFSVLSQAVAHLPLRAATGDIGILMAAVDGLNTSHRRKAALRRHIWRPRRFRALLDRFGGRSAVPASRVALLAGDRPEPGPHTGLRSPAEIEARIAALHEDAQQPPISGIGFSSQAFAPHFPHTVRLTETKTCSDCHLAQAEDNNAIMAQLLLLGTNFVNFVGLHAFTGLEGEDFFRALGEVSRGRLRAWRNDVIGATASQASALSVFQKYGNKTREAAAAYEIEDSKQ